MIALGLSATYSQTGLSLRRVLPDVVSEPFAAPAIPSECAILAFSRREGSSVVVRRPKDPDLREREPERRPSVTPSCNGTLGDCVWSVVSWPGVSRQ